MQDSIQKKEVKDRQALYDDMQGISALVGPVHMVESAQENMVVSIRGLHSLGVDVNTSFDNRTPLYMAAAYGHRESVMLLLQLGANPDALSMQNRTPLDAAMTKRHFNICRILCAAGASIKRADGTSRLAELANHDPLLQELRQLHEASRRAKRA